MLSLFPQSPSPFLPLAAPIIARPDRAWVKAPPLVPLLIIPESRRTFWSHPTGSLSQIQHPHLTVNLHARAAPSLLVCLGPFRQLWHCYSLEVPTRAPLTPWSKPFLTPITLSEVKKFHATFPSNPLFSHTHLYSCVSPLNLTHEPVASWSFFLLFSPALRCSFHSHSHFNSSDTTLTFRGHACCSLGRFHTQTAALWYSHGYSECRRPVNLGLFI